MYFFRILNENENSFPYFCTLNNSNTYIDNLCIKQSTNYADSNWMNNISVNLKVEKLQILTCHLLPFVIVRQHGLDRLTAILMMALLNLFSYIGFHG